MKKNKNNEIPSSEEIKITEEKTLEFFISKVGRENITCKTKEGTTVVVFVRDIYYAEELFNTQKKGNIFY